jgi:hypothetical protein
MMHSVREPAEIRWGAEASMEDEKPLITVESVIKAIRRGCKAEHDAGRSLLEMDEEYPGALIEVAPDMRRYIVEMEGEEGARTFRRIREISPAQIDWDEEPDPYGHNALTKR